MITVEQARRAGAKAGQSEPWIWAPDETHLAKLPVEAETILPSVTALHRRHTSTHRNTNWALLVVWAFILAAFYSSEKYGSSTTHFREVIGPITVAVGVGLMVSLICYFAFTSPRGWNYADTTRRALLEAFVHTALAVIARRRNAEREAELERETARAEEHTAQLALEEARAQERAALIASRPNPAPLPQPYGVSAKGAELIVQDWMRHLGERDAEVTQYSGDGGVDVAGSRYIAQVKHHAGAIGVGSIRELAGVAGVDGRSALFFSSN